MERSSALHLGLLAEQVTKLKQILQAERVLARDSEASQSHPASTPDQNQSRLIKSGEISFLFFSQKNLIFFLF